MKKCSTILLASLLLASCNGDADDEGTIERVDDDESVVEESDTEPEESDEQADILDEEDEGAIDKDAVESDSDEHLTHDFDGNSYYLSIQYEGMLDPFGTLVFDGDTVTLEHHDTFEGEYKIEGTELDINVSNDDRAYHIVLDIAPTDSEIIVEGNVKTYEVDAELTEDEQEAIDELPGSVFMMTKN